MSYPQAPQNLTKTDLVEAVKSAVQDTPLTDEERDFFREDIIAFAEWITFHTIKFTSKQVQLLLICQDMANKRIIMKTQRGGGKTFLMAIIALWSCLCFDNYHVVCLGGSLEQSEKVYEYIRGYIYARTQISAMVDGGVNRKATRFLHGSQIKVLTASQKSVRGAHPSLVLADEYVEIEPPLIDAAMGMLVSTSFGIHPHKRFICASTAQAGPAVGRFQDLWEGVPENGYIKFGWSCFDCTWIDPDEIEQAKNELSQAAFDVEWRGMFGTLTGLIFDPKDIEWAIRNATTPRYEFGSAVRTFAGLDWGYIAETALVVCQQRKGARIKVIYVRAEAGRKFEDWQKIIKQAYESYQWDLLFADASHVGENQRLADAGIPLTTIPFGRRLNVPGQHTESGKPKPPALRHEKDLMIENAKFFFETQKIELHKQFPGLIHQTKRYHWVLDRDGNIVKASKSGVDRIESFMLALRGFRVVAVPWETELGVAEDGYSLGGFDDEDKKGKPKDQWDINIEGEHGW